MSPQSKSEPGDSGMMAGQVVRAGKGISIDRLAIVTSINQSDRVFLHVEL